MTAKRVYITTNFLADGRIPKYLRREPAGWLNLVPFGATNLARTRIFIDVAAIHRERGYRSFVRVLLNVMDHEYAHAFAPPGNTSPPEEELADRFYDAGAWARR